MGPGLFDRSGADIKTVGQIENGVE